MSGEDRTSEDGDNSSYEEKVCQRYACAIQDCLSRRNYDEKKCRKQIERWKQCLKAAREEADLKKQKA